MVTALITVPATIIAFYTPTLKMSLVAFSIAAFCNFAAIALMWTIPMELVAASSGFMLAWGSFAGVLSPIIMGVILDKTSSFNNAYYIFASAALISALLAIPLYFKEGRRGAPDSRPPVLELLWDKLECSSLISVGEYRVIGLLQDNPSQSFKNRTRRGDIWNTEICVRSWNMQLTAVQIRCTCCLRIKKLPIISLIAWLLD